MTLEELKALYGEKGAMEQRVTPSEQGDIIDYIPIQYGDGWTASEKDNRKIIDYIGSGMDATPVYDEAPKTLGGFSKQEGDYVYNYDPEGNYIGRTKWNENDLKTMWNDLGPIVMAAASGPLGGWLGESLGLGLTGASAAGAGGALVGGVNAAINDQDILKGALLGGASSAGGAKLGDTGFTLGDVKKAYDFSQNPNLASAINAASPFVTTNFDIGNTGYTTSDLLKGLSTANALTSGNEKQAFDAIVGLAKGSPDLGGLSPQQQQEFENIRLQKIANAVLNQPASDDGTTGDIQDLIRQMTPYEVKGLSKADLAKFIEANMDEFQGSAELETLLKGEGQKASDEGTMTVTGDRPKGLGNVTLPDNPDELVITGKREGEYVPGIRTKEIKSDIPDFITPDQIDKFKFDTKIDDILQTVTPATKTTVTPTKTTTPGTQTTQQALVNLGLNAQMPSQDPYANIKLMEELFGGDTAYKLRALGAPRNLASADLDALARLLRG